jgi:DNA-binding CsgD family transcriptional regulator
LSLYTEEQLLTHPDLAIAAGWYYTTAGGTCDEELHWTRIMTHYRFDDGPTATSAASLRSSWLILMSIIAPHGLSEMRRVSEEAVRLETEPGDWRASAESSLAYAQYLAGATKLAERTFRDSLRGRPFAGTRMEDDFSTWNLAMLALIAEDDGRWGEAAGLVAEIERRRPSMGLDQEPHPHWLPHLLARLRLMSHRGDPQTVAFMRSIDDFVRPMTDRSAGGILVVGVLLGEVALEQGDMLTARQWCGEALSALAEWPDAGVFGKRAKALKDALERRVMTEPISPAERRVLELLPTRLTVAHLAERLFLSQATVKAHLRAIYRKLEVGTREEAVERARELGLLKR